MPIIPAGWSGLQTVNAIDTGGAGSGSPIYQFAKSVSLTILELDTFIDLVGTSTEPINRELSLDIVSGGIRLYWKNLDDTYALIDQSELISEDRFTDTSLGKLGLAIKAIEPSELFFAIKWDTDLDFYIYTSTLLEDLMINPQVRLLLGTGNNYIPRNVNDFDSDPTQYLINLNKIKNSDTNTTGFKMFDIYCFYPGKPITFNIVSDSSVDGLAMQLFDPVNVAEAIFDVANDVINAELNDLSSSFVGNVTRSAYFIPVINDQITVTPNFSIHLGRFIGKSQVTHQKDTVIIRDYLPNSDPSIGGAFVLTGEF
ncbi:hypothetical protein PCC9214_05343 [Planktothrix tepida]|uniref:Uncharacterized protein n=1 Tax=Planktothrix tepida PCC 9214 TaxID=671072 RepID=A0A1J1LJC7_9CYAN|nr:hypothetical protein [Planktothrix tepida]CAD5984824.1 hypothetical protein PCC9214_05305 [Planktothrix tepida]CAD5985106.1 hypothetical protein PCC9214_05343 [Planktothrix tepida]CUR32146.1 hypothetical protein PL9214430118 [Planktothrix tepida PCC 9214]